MLRNPQNHATGARARNFWVRLLVGERKLRTSADPFVIALGQVERLQIVTDEKPTGSAQRPNIPDVVTALGLPPCMGLLELIRAEKWIVG